MPGSEAALKKIFEAVGAVAALAPLLFAVPAFGQGAAPRPIVKAPQKYTATPPLPARVWRVPEGTVDLDAVKPSSSRVVLVGREGGALRTSPEQGEVIPGRIPVATVVAVDFDVDYDRFEVSKAMAKGEWGKAVGILRKAYTPFFPYLDVPENNVLEGSMDLGVTMFKCARATMRTAASDEERAQALQQYAAAEGVFNACAKAKWSDLGTLALLRACHCMVLIDAEKARRAGRVVDALDEPSPGDETYGYYWLLKAELARIAGNVTNELDAAVKSLAFENKDVETFPDALMLSADCYQKLGNPYRARDVYFEVAKLFPGTDWATDARDRLSAIMESGVTREAEDTTAESTFFGLEEDMNALADALIDKTRKAGTIFDYDEEEAEASEVAPAK